MRTSPEVRERTMNRSTSIRHATYRKRKARGARIIRIEVREEHVTGLLTRHYLKADDGTDREVIGRAVETLLGDVLGIPRAWEAHGAYMDSQGSAAERQELPVRVPSTTVGATDRPNASAYPEAPRAVAVPYYPAKPESAELLPGESDAPVQPVPRRPSAAEELGAGLFDGGVPPWENQGHTTGSKCTTGTWPDNAASTDELAFKPLPKPNDRWPTDAEIVAAFPSIFAAYYVAALRDHQIRGWWMDNHGQMVSDRTPIPEDFMRPAEAARMRQIGDPLEVLRRRRAGL
jgi:hypothetical protein